MSDPICLNHLATECSGQIGCCRYERSGLQGERSGLGRYRGHRFVGIGEECELCQGDEWDRAHDLVGDVIVSEPLARARSKQDTQ